MAKRKLRKVLYFINGVSATPEDEAEMATFGQGFLVCIRNATKIGDGEAIEPFDVVAGAVPERYAAVAAEQGEPEEPAVPVVPAASVPAGSPVKANEKAGEAKPEDKPAAKPKAPAAKPGAASGWKPNA